MATLLADDYAAIAERLHQLHLEAIADEMLIRMADATDAAREAEMQRADEPG